MRRDGALRVRHAGIALGCGVVAPAEYVSEHVDLGYAVTAHRAQGITTDTAHVLVSSMDDAREPVRRDDAGESI